MLNHTEYKFTSSGRWTKSMNKLKVLECQAMDYTWPTDISFGPHLLKSWEMLPKSLDFPHPPGQQQSMGIKESFPPSKGPLSPLLHSPCRHLIYTDHLTWASVALVSYPPDPVCIWLCKLEDTLFTVTSALTKGWPNQQHSQLFQFGWALGSILKRGLLWGLASDWQRNK